MATADREAVRSCARLSIPILLAAVAAWCASPVHAAVVTRSGTLDAFVTGFVATIPRAGTEGYDPPTRAEAQALADSYRLLRAGRLADASSTARGLGYDVLRFTDTATGARFDMLVERRRRDGTWPHAWGLYIRRTGSLSRLRIAVAHPVADLYSELAGLEMFRRARAGDLFVAGAHRYADVDGSSDVARRSDSVFQAVVTAATGSGDRLVEPHGFADSTAPTDTVVSTGAAAGGPLLDAVAANLRATGFSSCVFDGRACSALGATENVQGEAVRAAGGQFLHIEMARRVRDSVASRTLVSDVVADVAR